MVAPYTLILTSNGSKKAWPPRKTPQNNGYLMSAIQQTVLNIRREEYKKTKTV
jgi:hypothetical protein